MDSNIAEKREDRLRCRYSADLYFPRSIAKIRSTVAALFVVVIASSDVGARAMGCGNAQITPHPRRHKLCQAGHRKARIKPIYREHLAKHFADTYSRIGLPRPYETM